MTAQQKKMVIGDFEKYMRFAVQQQQGFTLENFVSFATALVNFYAGSALITVEERSETATILLTAFNSGIGNQIDAQDLQQLTDLIISDSTIDYSILSPIFG
ncbi:hypothetical protein PQ465_06295 [Sphingobacterium oryzagri]|uniref:Phage protein n=1 Tax=Sphingobacterium oryzagri TaxID=3025669 RepID=A0ABY7WK72_9SPHI|nr:hypothetical protein [Sphingobacterium sp. KACC 22765]WDF69982.1 hypothetical protein PQ465_06295 [Sphingobacterium sp. KACC 22765]